MLIVVEISTFQLCGSSFEWFSLSAEEGPQGQNILTVRLF